MLSPVEQVEIKRIAVRAGKAILDVYNSGFEVSRKQDNSYVTDADRAAHEIIVNGLTALSGDRPILSEEGNHPSFEERQRWTEYWLIDPLDGTRAFVDRIPEFTVNIALVVYHVAQLGVVYDPVGGRLYFGNVSTSAATLTEQDQTIEIRARHRPNDVVKVFKSRTSRTGATKNVVRRLRKQVNVSEVACSSSLKLCHLASGDADVYPRYGHTSEWDLAAGHAVLGAAGGGIFGLDGEELLYNKKDSLLNDSFFAVGDLDSAWLKVICGAMQ